MKTATIPQGVYALAAASFAMGTEGYVYVGHLNALAADLGQDLASMGQLASAFAITYAVTAPFTAAVMAKFGRREVLMTGLLLIGVLNLLAGLSNSYALLIALRIACGVAAGMIGPIASVAATELVPNERRGKAMGIVMSGMTAAFVLGIPMGSVVGEFLGWRGTFLYAGLVAILAAISIRIWLPRMHGSRTQNRRTFVASIRLPVLLTYLLTLIGFAATFTTIAFIGPLVTAATGLTGSGIGTMQGLIGIGSILGIALGIRIADTRFGLKAIAISFAVTALSMTGYSVVMFAFPIDSTSTPMTLSRGTTIAMFASCMICGAAALFSRNPVIQTRLIAQATPEARPVLLALNGSMVFLGQGLGAAIGGLSIATLGLAWIGVTAATVAALGTLATLLIDRREHSIAFFAQDVQAELPGSSTR